MFKGDSLGLIHHHQSGASESEDKPKGRFCALCGRSMCPATKAIAASTGLHVCNVWQSEISVGHGARILPRAVGYESRDAE